MRKHEIILSILTIVSGIPCFGKHTIFGDRTLDGREYEYLLLAIRGEFPFDLVEAPFRYRPLIPFMASLLPFDAGISFGIVNTIVCILITLTVYWNCKQLNIDADSSFKAAAIVAISWNILLYGTAVLVDPAIVMFWSVFILAVNRNEKFAVLFVIGMLAILVKEVAIVMSITLMFDSKSKGIILGISQGILIVAIRMTMTIGTMFEGSLGYLWWIDIVRNLILVPFIEVFLAFILIIPGAYIGLKHNQDLRIAPTLIPALLVALTGFLYGSFCGRFVWLIQISLAPFLALGISYWSKDLHQLTGDEPGQVEQSSSEIHDQITD